MSDVAPFAGAWIEISVASGNIVGAASLPSRERGLKFLFRLRCRCVLVVAPFAGAWIEIYQKNSNVITSGVAPFAGAWIEIKKSVSQSMYFMLSLPSRERGLKFCSAHVAKLIFVVAPFAGAWIEIRETF